MSASSTSTKHDLTARLGLIRTGGTYLCPHTHLDRDLSGAVVFAGNREANAGLAQQAEERTISFTYLAAVVTADLPDEGQIRTQVIKDGRNVLRPVDGKKGQAVRIAFRVRQRMGERILLQAESTDGPRAVRAALCSVGAPVVGDVALGGEAAHRLMLHANQVGLRHPCSAQTLSIEAPAPWSFEPWVRGARHLEDLDPSTWEAAFQEAGTHRFPLVATGYVDAFRIVHGEGEGLSGLDVDWFDGFAVIWLEEGVSQQVVSMVLEAARCWNARGVYVKLRPKQASLACQDTLTQIPAHALWGCDAPDPLVVREGDLRYLVRLGEGYGTGLFLDQRSNRGWLRVQSAGKRVLNLFAHTCAFTVVAAAGGARHTVSVDISKRALAIGKQNLDLNGLADSRHQFVCDDIKRWLERACRQADRFDIVVLDPPSFGSSRWARFVLTRDFIDLAAQCISLLDEGGWLLACTNHRGVGRRKFRRWLEEAAVRAGRRMEKCEDCPVALDFPFPAGQQPHMKAVICKLRSGARIEPTRGRSAKPTRRKKR